MIRAIISPSKYVQGSGILTNFKDYVDKLGNSFFVISDAWFFNQAVEKIEQGVQGSNIEVIFEKFNSECSRIEIDRLVELSNKNNCNVIVGIGGGKTLDIAKAVAYYAKMPVVIVPTIASTDAPCSSLSAIYTEKGVFSEYLVLSQSPNVVIVDTDIIAKAPVRFLAAGMGDALSTYFEVRACLRANGKTMAGYQTTKAAIALAELCYSVLLEDGVKAKISAERGVVTKALENIVEANIYLSGIGFESGGLAAAHAIHNGLTVLEEMNHISHGEKVAFATIVQLVLENSPMEEIEEVINFCLSVGLPTTLEDMGIKTIIEEDIMKAAVASCAEGNSMKNMPFRVVPEDVYAAILAADTLGKQFK
ncbi:glycerol dehydrogenase [Clostridium polyendosporum]|uniref:Glycerol dehydrogenase n=1 Tax=Clostridium polyendosporum TaxID=69208 RepID=A0A919RYQ8_9CLOT|nr:glycerol dehydrogenase [Clostridium polyendosporum]GIM28806.1 glycerol dehydrogenase [Clostridium polyendosporum]